MSEGINENPSYLEYLIPEYQVNPLVEALNPPPADLGESIRMLALRPTYHAEEIELPPSMRLLLPKRLESFMFPSDQHAEIHQRIYSQVKQTKKGERRDEFEKREKLQGSSTPS